MTCAGDPPDPPPPFRSAHKRLKIKLIDSTCQSAIAWTYSTMSYSTIIHSIFSISKVGPLQASQFNRFQVVILVSMGGGIRGLHFDSISFIYDRNLKTKCIFLWGASLYTRIYTFNQLIVQVMFWTSWILKHPTVEFRPFRGNLLYFCFEICINVE